MSGCLIALAIVGGLILLGGLLAAFFVYRFVSSPDGQKIVSAVTSGAALASEAASAPGTKELRGIGCTNAAVFDAAKVEAIARTFGDAGAPEGLPGERLAIVCEVRRGGTAPTCDQVATTYLGAIGGRAAGPFQVTVGVANGGEPGCEERYSAEGKRVEGGHRAR